MTIIPRLALLLCLLPLGALADGGNKYSGENRGKPLQPRQVAVKWQQECGSCHLAFAPGLLPAESWRKIMSGLDRHFGADASVTDAENKEVTAFLTANSSNRWTATTSPLRITESKWFISKHQGKREIPPDVWKRPSIKSPANCQACHLDANEAVFEENRIRIPN